MRHFAAQKRRWAMSIEIPELEGIWAALVAFIYLIVGRIAFLVGECLWATDSIPEWSLLE